MYKLWKMQLVVCIFIKQHEWLFCIFFQADHLWAIKKLQTLTVYSSLTFSCTFKTTYKFKSLLHPFFLTLSYLLGYALDRLVTVSSMHYCTSTSALSTLSSSRGLTTCVGISHLEGGFTLRCLQRLSLPDLATLPCSWRNNRYTSGQSSPVLSY